MNTERERIVADMQRRHPATIAQLVTYRQTMDARRAYNNVDANQVDPAFSDARAAYNALLAKHDNDTIASLKLAVLDHLAPKVNAPTLDMATVAKLRVKDAKHRAPKINDHKDNLAEMRRGTGEQLRVAVNGDIGNLHIYSWDLTRDRFVQWKCISARTYQIDNPGSYKAVYETGKDTTRQRMIVTTANVKTLFANDLTYQKVTR